MDPNPLHVALFATEDEIERGFIDALIDAFDQGSDWPTKLYHSGKGADILSKSSFLALGEVVRSVRCDEAANKIREESLIFGGEALKMETGSETFEKRRSKPTRRVSCLTLRKIHGVGAKISSGECDDLHHESPPIVELEHGRVLGVRSSD